MYQCSNCNGGLKFDIASQTLACEYCNSQYNPYEIDGLTPASEDNSMDVTMFTCSHCGGELYATDTSVTSFCSFCGSTAVLESRIVRELRPDYIIPFQKTKEDCKKEYVKMMRMAIFAPKELKDKKHIDGFRGIYMPYWMYDVDHTMRVNVDGTKDRRRGDYIITSHYQLSGDLRTHYNGISYDGSSSFADNISEKIAPFDVHQLKKFTPGFMSGFYADTADVEHRVYEDDVINEANKRTGKFLRKQQGFNKYEITDSSMVQALGRNIAGTHRAMFPVWFMSYRNNDRVAYATVNGQTGKVVADLPVDIKKYLLGTLILAIPIFILLNLFFTVTPSTLLAVVSFISALVAILHAAEMKEIVKRDGYEDDKGRLHKILQRQPQQASSTFMQEKKKEKKQMPKVARTMLKVLCIYVGISFVLPVVMFVGAFLEFSMEIIMPVTIALVVSVIAFIMSLLSAKKLEGPGKVTASLFCMVAVVIALLIAVIKPVHDIFYYAGATLSLIAIFVTLLDLIAKYNILATRKLPQFDYKGGDDNA